MKTKKELNEISGLILHAAIEVHRHMGPGLLESVYEICLKDELNRYGLKCDRQVIVPLIYKGKELSKEFRLDILVENEVVVEVKAVEFLHNVHEAQIISYLKLADKKLGLLINFNEALLKDGFRRFVNNF